jgi:O-antigen/teichoic acid export membrane protein
VARRAVRSSVWVVIGFVAQVLLRLVSSVVLTRFIHPETYGLMDLITTIVVALHLFSDIGLLPCIVQSPRGDDPRCINTVWTMILIRGVILFFIACAIAVPISHAYHRPILAWLLPVVGSINLLESLASTGVLVLARHVQRGRLVLIEFIGAVFTFLGTLIAIFFWNRAGFDAVIHGRVPHLPFDESLVWTIVMGSALGRAVATTLTYVIIPGPRPRFDLERQTIRDVFGFGRWVFLSTTTHFVSQQGDRLLAPKVSDFTTNGLYGRALGLVAIGTGLIEQLANTVVFPIISRTAERGNDVQPAIVRIGLLARLLTGALLTGLFVSGPSLVHLLYPESYSDVAWILQACVAIGWLQCQSTICGSVLLGVGKPAGPMVANLGKIIAVVIFVVPLSAWARRSNVSPIIGLLGGVAIGEFLRYATYLFLVVRTGLWSYLKELAIFALTMTLAGIATSTGHLAVREILGGIPRDRWAWAMSLLMTGSVVLIAWGLVALALFRSGRLRWSELRK